jgi:glucosamine--fructose-6-phosphate aminotransferase (isomerizing)
MCGIIGILGTAPVADRLVEALRHLEYRGYDSAGIAVATSNGLARLRRAGKLHNLATALLAAPLTGDAGIGHTRWATHGAPTETNAHPHVAGQVCIVHNGIIENHAELAAELSAAGRQFESETDTEVLAHLLDHKLSDGTPIESVMADLMPQLRGAFAFAALFEGGQRMVVGRRASPLAIGFGGGEMYVGSDALALAGLTRRLCYLEEGDWALIDREGVQVFDLHNNPVNRPVVLSEATGALIGKGNYRHFMEREIHEQPEVLGYTLAHYLDSQHRAPAIPDMPIDPATLPRLTIVAAGTSFYAGVVAKYWLEHVAGVLVEVDIASEFRYREAEMPAGGAALFISQSGESLDTLMALRYARQKDQVILALVNQPESSIAREADVVLPTRAGTEIGVASTKAFTTQLMALAVLTLDWAGQRGRLSENEISDRLHALSALPELIGDMLSNLSAYQPIAHALAQARDVLYLGRGTSYPIAMEGALKLKELSYIHAEGYAAGEMKHGPIALIDEGVPVVMVAPSDALFEKTASNAREVLARGGRVILLSDAAGVAQIGSFATHVIALPDVHPFVAPILYSVPVQVLAYMTALEKGTDIDQPRNLAKSVTVE